jgi:hypothetical protein
MSSEPIRPTAGQTLRHWSIDNRQFVGGPQRPARALPIAEGADGNELLRLASKLARVKSELARRHALEV